MSAQKKSSKKKKEIDNELKNKGSFYKDEYNKNLRKKKEFQIMSKYLQNIVSPTKEEPSKKAAATKKVTGSKKARKKTQEK